MPTIIGGIPGAKWADEYIHIPVKSQNSIAPNNVCCADFCLDSGGNSWPLVVDFRGFPIGIKSYVEEQMWNQLVEEIEACQSAEDSKRVIAKWNTKDNFNSSLSISYLATHLVLLYLWLSSVAQKMLSSFVMASS